MERTRTVAGHICGYGLGADIATARDAALADMAGQLMITIQVDRRTSTRQDVRDGGDGAKVDMAEEYLQSIKTSTVVRDLASVSTVHTEAGDFGVAIVVGISEQSLTSQFTARIAALDRTLAPGTGQRPAQPDSAWIARLKALLAAATEREALAAVVASRGVESPPIPLAAAVVRTSLGGMQRTVVLSPLPDESPISAAVRTVAGDLGLPVSAEHPTHRFIVSIRRSDTTTARGWPRVTLAAEIIVQAGDRAIGQITVEGAGTSTTTADKAAFQAATAVTQLASDALRSNLLTILIRDRLEP